MEQQLLVTRDVFAILKYVRFHTQFYMSGIQQGYAVTNKVVNIDIISKCLRKGMGYVGVSVNRFHNNV